MTKDKLTVEQVMALARELGGHELFLEYDFNSNENILACNNCSFRILEPYALSGSAWIPDECKPRLDEIHPKFKKDDPVNHPSHYTQHPSGVECIQITEHMNFNIGNAVKYLWRADLKNGLEDLEKAAWYIQREIERQRNGTR